MRDVIAKVSARKITAFHIAGSKFDTQALRPRKQRHAQITVFEAGIFKLRVFKATTFNITRFNESTIDKFSISEIGSNKVTSIEITLVEHRTGQVCIRKNLLQ